MNAFRTLLLALAVCAIPTSSGARAEQGEVPSEAAVEAPQPESDAAPEPTPAGPERSPLHRRLDRASDFAPAGIVLDHTHEKGDWTFSYRYVQDRKEGLLEGSDTPLPIYGYSSVPLSRKTSSHLFGVMYAPRDRFTFALSLPFMIRDIELATASGARTRIQSRGIGDARLIFLVPFVQKGNEMTHVRVGMSFPTGSIEEKDALGNQLPYAMQLGSGSWDAQWGLTYTGQLQRFSWGGQFEGLYRLGKNQLGYQLGTDYHASIWGTMGLADWLSFSGRFAWKRRGNIHGEDKLLYLANPDPSVPPKSADPLNDNKRQGGTVLEVGPGLNILLPVLGGQRLAFEAVFPVYQNLDGPQLGQELTFTAGWQWLF